MNKSSTNDKLIIKHMKELLPMVKAMQKIVLEAVMEKQENECLVEKVVIDHQVVWPGM